MTNSMFKSNTNTNPMNSMLARGAKVMQCLLDYNFFVLHDKNMKFSIINN